MGPFNQSCFNSSHLWRCSTWLKSKSALALLFVAEAFSEILSSANLEPNACTVILAIARQSPSTHNIEIHLGHHIIEGAQPASLQSLGGALTVAPLFAFYEGLWLLGINKELQATTLAMVDQLTRELCTSGAVAMRACGSL